MSDGLQARHREQIINILLQCPNIRRAVLFGSRAMGSFSATSDIDIALYGEISLREQAKLADQLQMLSIPYKVDLVRMQSVTNAQLSEHVERYGKEWINRM